MVWERQDLLLHFTKFEIQIATVATDVELLWGPRLGPRLATMVFNLLEIWRNESWYLASARMP